MSSFWVGKNLIRQAPAAVVISVVGVVLINVLTQFFDRYELLNKMMSLENCESFDQFIPRSAPLMVDTQWWVGKVAGRILIPLHTFTAILTISFSALFQVLCLLFIMWKKWSTINSYLTQFLHGEANNLGVF